MIVVTPHLVAPIKPGQVRLPTDRVREPNEVNTFLLGQPYQAVELPPVVDPLTARTRPAAALDPGNDSLPAPVRPKPAAAAAAAPPASKDEDYAF